MKKSFCFLFALFALNSDLLADTATDDELSLEELLSVEVTSVSKKAQSLSDAAAAIFVITNEDIRRVGATSIPEALRLAPGIDVARVNSSKWAVTARGFNGIFANKLLVMIDGRSIYTPAFSGVYWDIHDVMLEDVKRIEVIRGPGATLWGANAVNGVINIITKSAEETQGGRLTGGFGTEEQGFGALRYGVKLGEDTFARAYVKGFHRDEFPQQATGENSGDDWFNLQGGFRLDSRLSDEDEITFQGNVFRSDLGQQLIVPSLTSANFIENISDKINASGWNISANYRHTLSATDDISLQVSHDYYERKEFMFKEQRHTFDLDFQHHFKWGEHHDIVWGLGYRYSADQFENTTLTTLSPTSRNIQLFSGFIQDEIMLVEDALWFTLGSKFEHNDYTGFEMQPSARLMWIPHQGHRVWAAVSRSVRTPSRAEHDMVLIRSITPVSTAFGTFPFTVSFNGSDHYKSEVQMSYELGYRFNFENSFSVDIAAFYTDYNRVRGNAISSISSSQVSFEFNNDSRANTYGVEIAGIWQMLGWWRWDANYSYIETDITGSVSGSFPISPRHQASLRAIITPVEDVNIDLFLRYVDESTAINPLGNDTLTINDYISLDLRVGWKPVPSVELSIVGQNLLDDRHQEYVSETYLIPSEVPRAVYGKVDWQF